MKFASAASVGLRVLSDVDGCAAQDSVPCIRRGVVRDGAVHIYSLQPPPNPNLSDSRIPTGQRIFQREGWSGCHTPPLYTNNKLALAQGFTPPADHRQILDILPVSVAPIPRWRSRREKGPGIQSAIAQRRVLPRSLPARSIGHDARGDVQPRTPSG